MLEEYRNEVIRLAGLVEDERFMCQIYTILYREIYSR